MGGELGRARGSMPREETHAGACFFWGWARHHVAMRDWWIELLEPQGIGRWAGIRGRGPEGWWRGLSGTMRSCGLVGTGIRSYSRLAEKN